MTKRTRLLKQTPHARAVAVVLALFMVALAVPACGAGAATGALVGAAAGAAVGSTFDDPYCCGGTDPYYYATDPVAHDDTW